MPRDTSTRCLLGLIVALVWGTLAAPAPAQARDPDEPRLLVKTPDGVLDLQSIRIVRLTARGVRLELRSGNEEVSYDDPEWGQAVLKFLSRQPHWAAALPAEGAEEGLAVNLWDVSQIIYREGDRKADVFYETGATSITTAGGISADTIRALVAAAQAKATDVQAPARPAGR